MHTERWTARARDNTWLLADTQDGRGELRHFSISLGTEVYNSSGFYWHGLMGGTYETVPGNPSYIIDARKGTQFPATGHNRQNPLQERKDMSTVQKIQQERRERRERGTFERLYDEWDAAEITHVGVFRQSVKGETWQRLCTIVRTHDDRDGEPVWSILGRLNDVTWEDALAWLVDNRIEVDAVEWV